MRPPSDLRRWSRPRVTWDVVDYQLEVCRYANGSGTCGGKIEFHVYFIEKLLRQAPKKIAEKVYVVDGGGMAWLAYKRRGGVVHEDLAAHEGLARYEAAAKKALKEFEVEGVLGDAVERLGRLVQGE